MSRTGISNQLMALFMSLSLRLWGDGCCAAAADNVVSAPTRRSLCGTARKCQLTVSYTHLHCRSATGAVRTRRQIRGRCIHQLGISDGGKQMLRMTMIGAAVGACVLFTGCASIVSGHNQSVSVTTKNNGADVSGA